MKFRNGKLGCRTRSAWRAVRGSGLVKRVRYFQTKPQALAFATGGRITWGAVPVDGSNKAGRIVPGIVTRGK